MSLQTWMTSRRRSKANVSGDSPSEIITPRPALSLAAPVTPQKYSGTPVGDLSLLSTHYAAATPAQYATALNEATAKSLPSGISAARAPRSRFYDPLSLMYATGYKNRRFSISYEALRRVAMQVSLVGAIINTRVNQVAAFARPFRGQRQIGFSVRFKDDRYQPSEEEQHMLERIEMMIQQCGFGNNPHNRKKREPFDVFLRKVTRDSLTLDQACFEVVPDGYGRPYEFHAVDAASVRLASTFEGHHGENQQLFHGQQFTANYQQRNGVNPDFTLNPLEEDIYTVQLLHGRIENVYRYYDMAFCIRNPRTDILVNGYGLSEIEMALNAVIGMLNGELYNTNFFSQNSTPKGIINIKGEDITPEQMDAFRRQWYAMVSGVENQWKTPILQAEGIEYQTMQNTNREMEFANWLNYLLKQICAAYAIDPAEINFDDLSGGGSQGAPLFESKHEWKLKHSRDKGLRPLLKHIAEWIQHWIVEPMDSRLQFDFVGLDELTEAERIELIQTQTSTTVTINEARAQQGRPPLVGGDIINSPTYLQNLQMMNQAYGQKFLDQMAPWATQSEEPEPDYGEADPVPLWAQFPEEEPDPMAAGGMPPGGDMGGDMGGGMPPMG